MHILFLALAGGLGAVCRFGTETIVRARHKSVKFPISTLIINIVGCFLIGLFTGAHMVNAISTELLSILTIGFCGGYSTLSLVTVETLKLTKREAIMNVLVQAVLPFLASILGMYLGLTM